MKYAFAVVAAGAVVAALCMVILEAGKSSAPTEPAQVAPAQQAPVPAQNPEDEALKGFKIN